MNRMYSSPQEDSRLMERKLASIAIADENALQASVNSANKAHQKQDDVIRQGYITQLHNMHIVDDRQHEQDNHMRNVHHGEDLLKQIDDNKQRKLQGQRDEVVADRKRNDFLQKQEHDSHEFEEKYKQRFESNEHHKHDVAMMWRSENDHTMSEIDKLMDSTVDHCNFEEDVESNVGLVEIHRRLQMRKELLGQMNERIEASYRKFEEEKRKREELLLEVQREEELLKQLIEEARRKQSTIQKNTEKTNEGDSEQFADQEVNQMKYDMMENGHNHHHHHHTSGAVQEKQPSSLHSNFY